MGVDGDHLDERPKAEQEPELKPILRRVGNWIIRNPLKFVFSTAFAAIIGITVGTIFADPIKELLRPWLEDESKQIVIESVLSAAETDLKNGRFDYALAKVKVLIEKYGEFSELAFDLAYIQMELGNGLAARQALLKAHDLDLKSIQVRKLLANAYMLHGNPSDCARAVEHLEYIERRDPKNRDLLKNLARAYKCSGDSSAACIKAKILYPDDTESAEAKAFLESLGCSRSK